MGAVRVSLQSGGKVLKGDRKRHAPCHLEALESQQQEQQQEQEQADSSPSQPPVSQRKASSAQQEGRDRERADVLMLGAGRRAG
jgi:hypothetical protein